MYLFELKPSYFQGICPGVGLLAKNGLLMGYQNPESESHSKSRIYRALKNYWKSKIICYLLTD